MRNSRGMVTVELAVASLVAVMVLALGITAIKVVSLQVQVYDAAAEVARQVARGDDQAARAVQSHLPAGVQVRIRTVDDRTTVHAVASVTVPVIAARIPLEAEVSVRQEPDRAG